MQNNITVNPFTVDPVIRIFLEEADITTLKTLRELTSNWNQLDLQELEKRASEGDLEQFNFSFRGDEKYNSKSELEEAQSKLPLFLEGTRRIPGLFRDFRFHFPESFKFIQPPFFTQYSPMFVHLDFDDELQFDEKFIKILHNFLSWIGPTLKEIYFDNFGPNINISLDWPEISEFPNYQPYFPKLTKFYFRYGKDWLFEELRVIFGAEGDLNRVPNLIDLKFRQLDFPLDNLLGIDLRSRFVPSRWTKLTHLQIGGWKNIEITTNVLLKLSKSGMILKYLDLKFVGKNVDIFGISQNFGHFLAIQSKSLQSLSLSISLNAQMDFPEEFEAKIQLPRFEQVTEFYIEQFKTMINGSPIKLFELGTLSRHFPKLKNIIIMTLDDLMTLIRDESSPQPIAVDEIYLSDSPWDASGAKKIKDWLQVNFSSVVNFNCSGDLLKFEELPWGENLASLRLFQVKSRINLSNLTQLKYLDISECDKLNCEPEDYLEYFKDALELKNLQQIHFRFNCIKISEENKANFASYFPFPVEFKYLTI